MTKKLTATERVGRIMERRARGTEPAKNSGLSSVSKSNKRKRKKK